jgi:DNA polymerase I-like protein with 3'-5' exonuclease and polymerase domains
MDLITIDFETFYSQDFSLSKMTTEEYVRDPRFEVIGVSVKVNDEATEWASGTHEQLKDYFNGFDWKDSMVLAHNTMFDGAILSWLFDIHPRVWADTLCISRAVHGVEVGGSLKALAERYQIGAKGTEVLDAKGKRRLDFTDEELDKYGDYCINDVELTYKLFGIMGKKFPRQELKIIDLTLRMFIEPMLDLDLGLLEQHLEDTKELKDKLLLDAGVDKKGLMSNPKFAGLLEILGVVPPMKTSLTTGKETFAFAKSDEGFKALLEHEDVRVQTLVNARLGNKSTLEETRTQRFIDIAKRGLLPVPVKYYAAHTGRWGGADKINLQNLPSRGPNGKKLKKSMIAPDGYVLIDCDSSQIEARVLAWLAGQEDLTEAFRVGDDVYKKMAMSIYGANREEDVTKDQRFVGKTTILGAGYGMGAVRFKDQLQSFGFDIELDEARRVINIYRETNFQITRLWNDASHTIRCMEQGVGTELGINNVISVDPTVPAIILPSGLQMRYEDLRGEQSERGVEYTYKVRRGRNRIYGGKVIENVCQAVARCIIGEQMLKISKRYHVVLTVHDSVVCCVPEDKVEEAQRYIEECMRWLPDWAEGLPIDCESGVAKSYGDCE